MSVGLNRWGCPSVCEACEAAFVRGRFARGHEACRVLAFRIALAGCWLNAVRPGWMGEPVAVREARIAGVLMYGYRRPSNY